MGCVELFQVMLVDGKEAIDLLEAIINSDNVNYVGQGSVIVSAMILMHCTDNTCPEHSQFRATYAPK